MSPKHRFFLCLALSLGVAPVSAHGETIRIVMENIGFVPATASAKVGDTIEWVNKDILAHTATARNGDWDTTIGAKKTTIQVLKRAGTIDYYCRFHPNMKGRLTITP
jgi:plastocyanin